MDAWRRAPALSGPIGISLAFVTSMVAGIMSSSCIIPDKCIVITVPGTDWCVEVVGAQMWPAGYPEFTEDVRDDNEQWPLGCAPRAR
jgi:hypothetical protein